MFDNLFNRKSKKERIEELEAKLEVLKDLHHNDMKILIALLVNVGVIQPREFMFDEMLRRTGYPENYMASEYIDNIAERQNALTRYFGLHFVQNPPEPHVKFTVEKIPTAPRKKTAKKKGGKK